MFAAMEQVDVVLRINGNPAGSAKFSPAGSWKNSGRLSHWALSILLSATGLRYDGKRLNSPNDLVYKSDGALYFTDAPFGFPKFFDDPRKETPYSGVYQWRDGKVHLLMTDLTGPNGLAFSPDEKYFYVGNWDEKKKI